jgi:hypothetical protein
LKGWVATPCDNEELPLAALHAWAQHGVEQQQVFAPLTQALQFVWASLGPPLWRPPTAFPRLAFVRFKIVSRFNPSADSRLFRPTRGPCGFFFISDSSWLKWGMADA